MILYIGGDTKQYRVFYWLLVFHFISPYCMISVLVTKIKITVLYCAVHLSYLLFTSARKFITKRKKTLHNVTQISRYCVQICTRLAYTVPHSPFSSCWLTHSLHKHNWHLEGPTWPCVIHCRVKQLILWVVLISQTETNNALCILKQLETLLKSKLINEI